MLFDVQVVTEADYEAHLQSLQTQGNVSDQPLLGGIDLTDPVRARAPAGYARGRHAMTATTPTTDHRGGEPRPPLGEKIVRVLTTTDHKVIGKLYLTTSFAWFLVGGVMALIMRSELAYPGMQFVNDEVYNQLFTMHGTIMLLLFATPLFFGFGNVADAAADRLARRRVPAAEHVQLLALPLRRPDRRLGLPDPLRRRRLRLVRLHAAVGRRALTERRR